MNRVAATWVAPSRLDDRLDTRPYKPWVLNGLNASLSGPYLTLPLGGKRVSTFIGRGVGGSSTEVASIGVYKAKEITGYGFSAPERFVSSCKTSKLLQAEDVVLTSSGIGTIGRADLYVGPQHGHGARQTVDNHVAIIRLKPGGPIAAGFLVAFLNSEFGKAWSEWGTTGSTRLLELSPTRVGQFRPPVPPMPVQLFIGSKIRTAGEARLAARASLLQATQRFDELLATNSFAPSDARSNWVAGQELSQRMAAEFYLACHYDLAGHLRSLKFPAVVIGDLLEEEPIRSSTPARNEDASVPCILTSDIDPHEVQWREPTLWIESATHAGHKGKLRKRDVVYTAVGPPVGEAAVVLGSYLPMAAGGDVSIIRCGEELHPGFLSLYLNSVFGQMQNERFARGIRQRRVYPDDIQSFLIPKVPRDQQAEIGDLVLDYQRLNEVGTNLVNEAIDDVRALLRGDLDVEAITEGRTPAPTLDEVLNAVE